LASGTPVDRYTLRALISSAGGQGIELWQAYDPVLDRRVALSIIPRTHPRAAAAAQAAREAATVEHRNLVAVLDVLDEVSIADEDCTVIVHEWAPGRTLVDLFEEREGEPLPVADAVHLSRQITLAILTAHRAGIVHGRIRPGCLLISGSTDPDGEGEVRVRGLGVDRALWGESPQPPVAHPDAHGIGSLLYTAITARWPEGLADGVSGAPRHAGQLLTPTAVVADVPGYIDDICWRSIDARIWGFTPTVRSRGKVTEIPSYEDLDALLLALGGPPETTSSATTRLSNLSPLARQSGLTRQTGLARQPGTQPDSGPRSARGKRRVLRRVGASVLAAAAVAGVGLVGVRIIAGAPDPWGPDASPVAAPVADDLLTRTPQASADATLPGANPGLRPGEFAVSEAVVFGDDPTAHNPDTAAFAIDGNPLTAWSTDTYFSPDLSTIAAPVGLVLDLGTARAVSAVRLELAGTGSSVSIRIGSDPQAAPSTWASLAEAEGVTESIDLRSPRPVVGRYVLIWFTRLPPADAGFVGGLREVSVRS